MTTQNLMTAHFKKRETALKWLFMSFGYYILFVFLEDPRHMTISLIGKSRIPLFTVFCLFYIVSMLTNFSYLKRNFNLKSKLLFSVTVISNFLFGFVATTLMPDKSVGDVTVFATIVHWITGFGNILINATASLVFCLSVSKKTNSKALKATVISGAATCIADLLVFLILSIVTGNVQKAKNGFLEIIPLFVTYAALYMVNHTDLGIPRKERDENESRISIKDTDVFSAVCFALLSLCFFFFTFYAFIRNPVHFTISMIGVDYPIGFSIVGILLAFSFALNFIRMFKKFGYKNLFIRAVAVVGSFTILGCVFSPTKLGSDLDLIHSVSAIVFFYSIMGCFLWFLMVQSKKNKKQKPFMWGMLIIIILETAAMITLFIILKQRCGRTGLTELIPIEYMLFCFYIHNHTDYFDSENNQSIKAVLSSAKP